MLTLCAPCPMLHATLSIARHMYLKIFTLVINSFLLMPLYMDLHIIPGVKARDVAQAHVQDLLIQDEHGCTVMTYWVDEKRGNVFCLIEAPEKEAVSELHGKAHGLIPHRIIEVNNNLVE